MPAVTVPMLAESDDSSVTLILAAVIDPAAIWLAVTEFAKLASKRSKK